MATSSTWLAHTAWLVPLATVVGAVGAIVAAIAAITIGVQAAKVASRQKEIAGLSEVNRISERLNSRRYLAARKTVARGYLDGSVDEASASDLLDFIEEVSIYEGNGYIDVKTLGSLHSAAFICWWYAAKQIVDPIRTQMEDPIIWVGAGSLIAKLHTSCADGAPAWATEPKAAVMTSFFEYELKLVQAAEALMEAPAASASGA